MTDMDPLDRLISKEVVRASAPPRPVDDGAILDAVTRRSPKWRFSNMFGAAKFVVAGTIVALAGGFLAVNVLDTTPSDEAAPAAEIGSSGVDAALDEAAAKAVDFSGLYPAFSTAIEGEMAFLPDGFTVTGDTVQGVFRDMDDPRLNGTARYVSNRIDHHGAGDVVSYSVRIDNDGGSWLGTGHGFNDTANPDFEFIDGNLLHGGFDTTILRGTGEYEGLTAVMVNVATDDGPGVIGVVFSGEMPELPEMPAAPE